MLAAVGLFPFFRNEYGLTLGGKLLFGLGAALLVGAMSTAQLLNSKATDKNQEEIKTLINKRFEAISDLAMRSTGDQLHPTPPPTIDTIKITSPENETHVNHKHLIRGELSDHTGQVWVVVHPLGTSSYWVQPEISVKRSGEWAVTGYFGRAGTIDKGRKFEVLAITAPNEELEDGQILETWPESRFVSNSILVTRR